MKLLLFILMTAALTIQPWICSASPAPNTSPEGFGLSGAGGLENLSARYDEWGYYTVWWTDGSGLASFRNVTVNTYNMTWSGNGNSLGGKGWNPGTDTRKITYRGSYEPNGNSYLAVYGWTRNPLIEYYIVESYGTYDPSSAAQKKGTVLCDGSNYDVLATMRYNQPSIDGTQTYAQFWSVRNPKNALGSVSGQVDVACHLNAWRNHSMNIGTQHAYQVVLVEAYFSKGTAQISIDV